MYLVLSAVLIWCGEGVRRDVRSMVVAIFLIVNGVNSRVHSQRYVRLADLSCWRKAKIRLHVPRAKQSGAWKNSAQTQRAGRVLKQHYRSSEISPLKEFTRSDLAILMRLAFYT